MTLYFCNISIVPYKLPVRRYSSPDPNGILEIIVDIIAITQNNSDHLFLACMLLLPGCFVGRGPDFDMGIDQTASVHPDVNLQNRVCLHLRLQTTGEPIGGGLMTRNA